MQYKVPRIPIFSNLQGIDLRIQQIQVSLSSGISWLQYSFGLCDRVLTQNGEEVEVMPVCHVDNATDVLDMRPFLDDAHQSYCFWDMGDNAMDYSDNFGARAYPVLNYDVACIFVIHLDNINSDPKVARSMARQAILNYFGFTIRFQGKFILSDIIERDIEEIFEGYDIADPLIILRGDVAAFRVNGTITFKQDCNTTVALYEDGYIMLDELGKTLLID